MKAIGYIRVSTEDQAREGLSLDNQKAKIMTYAQLKEFDLVEIIADEGISAKNLNRPGIQKVLSMAKAKKIDAIIVLKLDRMFRSTIDALETTNQFDKQGIGFHSISESLDTQSAMGRFFFTLTAALAEMERGIIGERTKAALSHKRGQGYKTGGDVPFGFTAKNDGSLILDPVEQEALAIIKKAKASGLSLRKICTKLEEQNIRTKKGKSKWHPQVVSQILKAA